MCTLTRARLIQKFFSLISFTSYSRFFIFVKIKLQQKQHWIKYHFCIEIGIIFRLTIVVNFSKKKKKISSMQELFLFLKQVSVIFRVGN